MPNVQFFAKGQAAAYTIFETLKRQPAIDIHDPSGDVLEGAAVQGEITLSDVHFAYPARPDAPIFQVRGRGDARRVGWREGRPVQATGCTEEKCREIRRCVSYVVSRTLPKTHDSPM